MRVGLDIRGAKETTDMFDKLSDLNRITNIVQKNAMEGQRYSKRIAPVDTGNLRNLIRYYNENNGFRGRWTSEAEYALYQEMGTRNQSGTPHIRPSFEKQKVQFIKEIRGVLRD